MDLLLNQGARLLQQILFKATKKVLHLPPIHHLPAIQSREFHVPVKMLSQGKTLRFDRTFQLYLKDIEKITKRPLHPYQIQQVKEHLEKYPYRKLSSGQTNVHREEFNIKRNQIISEWEKITGSSWPVYDKPFYGNGKILRDKGARFDVHHIIENCFGGNNAAWNIHPARYLTEHQHQIHRPDGYANKIFNS